MKTWQHLKTITKHRWLVQQGCFLDILSEPDEKETFRNLKKDDLTGKAFPWKQGE